MGWRDLLADLFTPSARRESAYLWLLIAIGHAVAGAALAQVLPGPALLVPLVYWLVKEWGDLRRGGRVTDGLVDASFVALGALYGPWWWPVMVLGVALAGALLRARMMEPSKGDDA